MLRNIFHITTKQELDNASKSNVYTPANYSTEGFIHCSYAHQVTSVLNRFYVNVPALVLLEILPQKLTCAVVDENLEGGEELFPHVYGLLPLSAVVKTYILTRDDSGKWKLPELLE